jgi:hypothetical protein
MNLPDATTQAQMCDYLRALAKGLEHQIDKAACTSAADVIEEYARRLSDSIPKSRAREVFSRRLNLHYDQRAYSWHEIQDALEEIEALK